MRKPRNTDNEKAITLICKSVVSLPIEKVKQMLCVAVGHPPIALALESGVSVCLRCRQIVRVPFTWMYEGNGIWAADNLTPTDKLLTPMPATEKVPV